MGIREIIQIIPAVGWFAETKDTYIPLTCFALCKENGVHRIMPMIGEDFAEEIEGFIRLEYRDPNDSHYPLGW